MKSNQYLKPNRNLKPKQYLIKSFTFFLMLGCSIFAYSGVEDSQTIIDGVKVEQRVLEWADSVFNYHEGYSFNGFKAHYTDDFKALMARLDSYDQKIENLKESKIEGTYKGSESGYQKDMETLLRKRKKFHYIVESYEHKARYFEILFRSNIKTETGGLVYFLHHFRLSNHYMIMSSNVRSHSGDPGVDYRILYN